MVIVCAPVTGALTGRVDSGAMKPRSRIVARFAALLTASAALLAAAEASATNHSLWIHGRNTAQNTQAGNYADFSCWGPGSTAAGVNKKAVNWNGVGHISDTNGVIRSALDCFCTGGGTMRSLYNHNTTRST